MLNHPVTKGRGADLAGFRLVDHKPVVRLRLVTPVHQAAVEVLDLPRKTALEQEARTRGALAFFGVVVRLVQRRTRERYGRNIVSSFHNKWPR